MFGGTRRNRDGGSEKCHREPSRNKDDRIWGLKSQEGRDSGVEGWVWLGFHSDYLELYFFFLNSLLAHLSGDSLGFCKVYVGEWNEVEGIPDYEKYVNIIPSHF